MRELLTGGRGGVLAAETTRSRSPPSPWSNLCEMPDVPGVVQVLVRSRAGEAPDFAPPDSHTSGWFSVCSPRSRRQGSAYSAGSRESNSRLYETATCQQTVRARILLPGFGAVPIGLTT